MRFATYETMDFTPLDQVNNDLVEFSPADVPLDLPPLDIALEGLQLDPVKTEIVYQTLGTPVDNTIQTPPIVGTNTNQTATDIGTAVGTFGGTWLGQLLQSTLQSGSQALANATAPATASYGSSVIKEWLKKNWYYVLGVIAFLYFLIRFAVKSGKKAGTKRR